MAEIGVRTDVTTATTKDGGRTRRVTSHTYGQGVIPVAPDLTATGLRVYYDGQDFYVDPSRPPGGYPVFIDGNGDPYVDTSITTGGSTVKTDGAGGYYIGD